MTITEQSQPTLEFNPPDQGAALHEQIPQAPQGVEKKPTFIGGRTTANEALQVLAIPGRVLKAVEVDNLQNIATGLAEADGTYYDTAGNALDADQTKIIRKSADSATHIFPEADREVAEQVAYGGPEMNPAMLKTKFPGMYRQYLDIKYKYMNYHKGNAKRKNWPFSTYKDYLKAKIELSDALRKREITSEAAVEVVTTENSAETTAPDVHIPKTSPASAKIVTTSMLLQGRRTPEYGQYANLTTEAQKISDAKESEKVRKEKQQIAANLTALRLQQTAEQDSLEKESVQDMSGPGLRNRAKRIMKRGKEALLAVLEGSPNDTEKLKDAAWNTVDRVQNFRRKTGNLALRGFIGGRYAIGDFLNDAEKGRKRRKIIGAMAGVVTAASFVAISMKYGASPISPDKAMNLHHHDLKEALTGHAGHHAHDIGKHAVRHVLDATDKLPKGTHEMVPHAHNLVVHPGDYPWDVLHNAGFDNPLDALDKAAKKSGLNYTWHGSGSSRYIEVAGKSDTGHVIGLLRNYLEK